MPRTKIGALVMAKAKLPPLQEEAFEHGYKESTELHFTKCPHKNARMVSGIELRCTCGANWHGPDVAKLLALFQRA